MMLCYWMETGLVEPLLVDVAVAVVVDTASS